MSNALSFYGSKIILDGSNLFWSGPNHFGQVQIVKISPEKFEQAEQNDLDPTKTIRIRPK